MTSPRAFASLSLLVLVAACDPGLVGDASDPGVRVSPYITDGEEHHGHPSVGMLRSGQSNCSATLIGRRTVLTAAHCLKKGDTRFGVAGRAYRGILNLPHAKFSSSKRYDIGLVILERSVTGVQPSTIATGAPTAGQEITLIGFGRTSEEADDYGS